MICKFCGTESNAGNCPKCGMPMLIPAAQRPAPRPAPAPSAKPAPDGVAPQPKAQQTPPQAAATAEKPQPQQAAPQQAAPQQRTAAPAERPAPQSQAQPSAPAPTAQSAPRPEGGKPAMNVVNKPVKAKPPENPLCFKNVLWPAVALLLPLLYLFFELFAVLSAQLSGNGALAKLIGDLTAGNLDTVKISEMAEAMTAEQVPLYQAFSPFDLIADLIGGKMPTEGIWLLPAALVALIAVASAALAVFLIATRGQVLRSASFNSVLSIIGSSAVFAPLFGLLSLCVYYAATLGLDGADLAMQRVAIAPGTWLLMLILFFTLKPALAALRKLSATADGAEEYPLFPYRSAAKCQYKSLKLATVITFAASVGVLLCYLFLPVTRAGSLLDYCKQILGGGEGVSLSDRFAAFADVTDKLFHRVEGSVDPMALSELIMSLAAFLTLAVLLVALLHWVISLIRMARLKEDTCVHNKVSKRLVRSLAARVRNFAVIPVLCYALCQGVLTALLLFGSPMVAHLDFSNVAESMNAFYVTVFYLKEVGGLTVTFALAAFVAMLLWCNIRQLSFAILARTGKKTKKF